MAKTKHVMTRVKGVRKIDRLVARKNMEDAGMTRFRKKFNNKYDSYFSHNWRDYID